MDSDEREALAGRVVAHFRAVCLKLAEMQKDIQLLWFEFDCLPTGEKIMGCANRKEFCRERLGRTPRAVRYMLKGGNKRGENVSPVRTPSLTEDIWRQVRSFTSETRTLLGLAPVLQEFLTHEQPSDSDRENIRASYAAMANQTETLAALMEVIEASGVLEEPCPRPEIVRMNPVLLSDVLRQLAATKGAG